MDGHLAPDSVHLNADLFTIRAATPIFISTTHPQYKSLADRSALLRRDGDLGWVITKGMNEDLP